MVKDSSHKITPKKFIYPENSIPINLDQFNYIFNKYDFKPCAMMKLHPFDLEQQRKSKHSAAKDQTKIKSCLFAKYFPKYQKEFYLASQIGTIKSKIKNTKIIKSFATSEKLKSRSDWRVLLANKMKSVKTLVYRIDNSRQVAEQIRLFSGLQSMHILLPGLFSSSGQSQDKLKYFFFSKACQYIQRLQNLEHIQISNISRLTNLFLPRVNSIQRVLDSLKTLKFEFDWKEASDAKISEMIDNSKNLLKNVTHFKMLDVLHTPFHLESFQRMGELCSRISNLSFGFSNRRVMNMNNMYLSKKLSNEPFEVKTNFLQVLKGFQQLKTLYLCIHDAFTFFKDFALPPSIQNLKLDFNECISQKIMQKFDYRFSNSSEKEEFANLFEENSLLLRFYDSFKGLDHLETFESLWNVEADQEAYKYQNPLFQSLLKRISSPLKDLKVCRKGNGLFGRQDQTPGFRDLSLPQLIESCENFAPTLEKLEIGFLKEIPKFDLSVYQNKFPKLSNIEISASFQQLQNPDLETPGSLIQQVISLSQSITRIKLSGSVNPNAEYLLSMLKQINGLKKPEKLKIGLVLDFLHSNSQGKKEPEMSYIDGTRELENNKERYPKLERVYLKFFAGHYPSAAFRSFLRLYCKKFYSL